MKTSIKIATGILGLVLITPAVVLGQAKPLRVGAYLPGYRMADFKPEDAKGVTDLILFSAVPRADGTIDLSSLAHAPLPKFKEWKTQENGRLILALGGWGHSEGFAPLAASEKSRQKFAEDVLETCRELDLDGIDIDWEHPKNDIEAANYLIMLLDLQKALKPKKLTMSITVAGWQPINIQTHKSVDYIQLMAYDHDGKHSTYDSVTDEVDKLIKNGVPKEKIILGLPFYGRGITDRKKTLLYSEIIAKHHLKPDVDEIDGVYFNGPATIRRKTQFAKEKGLAGVMIWEIGQDARGEDSLLREVVDEIK